MGYLGGGSDRGPGSDLARAIEAAHEAVVAAPVLWARARGFVDVTPALVGAVLAIDDDGTNLALFRRDRGGSKQAASQLLAELRRRGYAELVASAFDGRAKVVLLSPRGLALRAACLEAERSLFDALVALVGGEASAIVAGLRAVAEGLESRFRVDHEPGAGGAGRPKRVGPGRKPKAGGD